MIDHYLNETGVFKNRLGIHNAKDFQRAENDYAKSRLYELEHDGGLKGNFDSLHLRSLHHYLFQDVYEWAGRTRGDEIEIDGVYFSSAPLLSKGEITFELSHRVNERLEHVLASVINVGFTGLNHNEFTTRVADLLSQLNAIHPFREGNGRTQRAFVNELARSARYFLDWGVVSSERMVSVSIASCNNDLRAMRRLIEEIADPVKTKALRDAIGFLEQQKINWNERYLATAIPGVTYAGVVVATARNHSILFSDDHQIIVARSKDIARGTDAEVHFTAH